MLQTDFNLRLFQPIATLLGDAGSDACTDNCRKQAIALECPAQGHDEVESRTGAVTVASRWLLGWAFASPASIRFGLALFPVPAHRTGQAELPHPALGRDSRCYV